MDVLFGSAGTFQERREGVAHYYPSPPRPDVHRGQVRLSAYTDFVVIINYFLLSIHH